MPTRKSSTKKKPLKKKRAVKAAPRKTKDVEVDGVAIRCAYDELVATDSVKPNPRNPNTHPRRQIVLLAGLITKHGWRAPITVSRLSGMIARGHGRYLAAKEAGLTRVPVDYQDYEDAAQEWADLIADNRMAELAVLDRTMLKDLLLEIDTGDFDMEMTAFTKDDIERLMLECGIGGGGSGGEPSLGALGQTGPGAAPGGRFILVYNTEEERQRWMRVAGIDGTKTAYTVKDVVE